MLKKGDKKFNSKLRKIEKHLIEHGSIDKTTAVAKFNEYYLPQVVSELKRQDNDIRFVNGVYMYDYEPKKEDSQFKVGDRVQFKSWEEMAKEYKLVNEWGDTYLDMKPAIFNTKMKHLCGTYATIEKIYNNGRIELTNFTADSNTLWAYTIYMIKPATDEPKLTTEKWEQIKNDYYIQEDETKDDTKEYYVVVAIFKHGNQITFDIDSRLFEDETKAKEYAEFGKRLDDSIIEYVIKKVSVM